MLTYNDAFLKNFIKEDTYTNFQPLVDTIHEKIQNKELQGSDFLGWYNLEEMIDKNEVKRIIELAKKIRENYEVLLVIGIGGSYLGAKCVIELVKPYFDRMGLEVIFAGNNMSTEYLTDVYKHIQNKRFCINVISKSGTTLEPALAFRLFKDLLQQQDPENFNKHIIATTDANKGLLREQAEANGWETFIIPDNVGGRFSVLTPVGLLPIACAGINIKELLQGAYDVAQGFKTSDLNVNIAYRYAVNRHALYLTGKDTEILVGYEPKISYLGEWWKQLFAESEGKNNLGVFPTSAIFSTDLHSIGQAIQEGKRNLFETVIRVKKFGTKIVVKKDEKNLDKLNYLENKSIQFCNDCALEATIDAHVDGGVPNMLIEIDALNPAHVGALICFFETAVMMGGYLNGTNPFNQPGVEEYKQRMFKLLGKNE